MRQTDFKFLDIVGNSDKPLCLILAGPFPIPYYSDGCTSLSAFTPLDIQNPKEWTQTFDAYVCWDLETQQHVICNSINLRLVDLDQYTAAHLFDSGTTKLRGILGLIHLANKLYKKPAVAEVTIKL